MYKGEWKGKDIPEDNRTLILGESHYGDENNTNEKIGSEANYDTSDVLSYYLSNRTQGIYYEPWYRFYDSIAESFGYSHDQAYAFYNQVWFGNYIPVLCEKKDKNIASDLMGDSNNRISYNNELFRFVNNNRINSIVCFSIDVYNHLPGRHKSDTENVINLGIIGSKRNLMRIYTYKEGEPHPSCDIILDHPLTVFAVRHPSTAGGFRSEQVYNELIKHQQFHGICHKL